jgi:hypothetical protein
MMSLDQAGAGVPAAAAAAADAAAGARPTANSNVVPRRFVRDLKLAGGAILVAALLLNIYASLAQRGLYADGASRLLGIIEHGGFILFETARQSIGALEQGPTVLALKFGVVDLYGLGVIFGLTLQLLPLAFVAACYPALPRQHRILWIFPLVFYLVGAQTAAFAPIAEGATATAYFWLVLILVTCRAQGPHGYVALVALAAPALYAHEVMVLLAPVLAAAAGLRATRERTVPACLGFGLLAAWFLVVAAAQIEFTVHPRDLTNRTSFIADMVEFRFIADAHGLNVPTVLGLLALAVSSGLCLQQARWPGRRPLAAAIVVGFGTLCAAAAVGPLLSDLLFWPALQFAARYYCAFLSLPLGGAFLICAVRPHFCAIWAKPPVLAVMVVLAVGQFGWQATGTYEWSRLIDGWRTVLSSHRGIIPWQEARRALRPLLPATGNDPVAKWAVFGWTFPSLSILLAPNGKVASIIAAPSNVGWQPFDPGEPAQLPRSPLLDFSAYRKALGR